MTSKRPNAQIAKSVKERKKFCKGRRKLARFCEYAREYCEAVGCSWNEL